VAFISLPFADIITENEVEVQADAPVEATPVEQPKPNRKPSTTRGGRYYQRGGPKPALSSPPVESGDPTSPTADKKSMSQLFRHFSLFLYLFFHLAYNQTTVPIVVIALPEEIVETVETVENAESAEEVVEVVAVAAEAIVILAQTGTAQLESRMLFFGRGED
jgi:hypothetical protein